MKIIGRARAYRGTGRRSQAERSEQMRRRLIDATITCLAKDGYVKTTIRRIASRAKVSHGATGHHFANKAALIAAAAEELVRYVRQMQAATLAGLVPESYAFSDRTKLARSPLHATSLLRAFLELSVTAQRDRGVAEIVQSLFNGDAAEIRTLIPAAMAAAPGREHLAAGLFPLTISLMLGMAVQYCSRGEHPDLAAQLDLWAQLVAPHFTARQKSGLPAANVY